ncbi:MAG: LysR family transcriptional regulator [Proteobacteria bacterium]|nr:LysR family transcriptional regulator [Pseudomonadota bacterium]
MDLTTACAVGPGKIALLEAIRRGGSLSQAARELRMSYRRAWLLLENLNAAFLHPVATLSTGGRGGGGARLTPLGTELIATYRSLEEQVERAARTAFVRLAREARARARPGTPRSSRRPVKPARRRA